MRFGGRAARAAVFYYSPKSPREHPEGHLVGYNGIIQADTHTGFNGLYVDALCS